MYIHQFYTNCLAHAAYYIESGNEAAIIDPLRDVGTYKEFAKERGAEIKYILETHFHADFVSGHLDLSHDTGALIVFGADATPGYKAHIARDGEMLPLGNIAIKVLHTPGHTIESACYLALDEHGNEYAVFTGDTLFVGDVGRPDLLSGNHNKEELAAMLYDSLNSKIKILPDDVIVYPGHGSGSACGKNIGKETYSTIGTQKHTNYALLAAEKDDFIKRVTSDLPTPPAYFFKDAAINKSGYRSFDEVVAENMKALTIDEFTNEINNGAIVLDTRDAAEFCKIYIPGAINVGLNGSFATWVGTLINFDKPIVLITTAGKEKETIVRLARVGFEQVKGYLEGGMHTWLKSALPMAQIPSLSNGEYEKRMTTGEYALLDVRNNTEAAQERIKGSVHIPLDKLPNGLHVLDKGKNWMVYCAGGYRSMIAASLLKASGFKNIVNVEGGITKVKQVSPQLIETGS